MLQSARTDWVLKWPGQLVIAGCQTYWTTEITEALEQKALKPAYDVLLSQVRLEAPKPAYDVLLSQVRLQRAPCTLRHVTAFKVLLLNT